MLMQTLRSDNYADHKSATQYLEFLCICTVMNYIIDSEILSTVSHLHVEFRCISTVLNHIIDSEILSTVHQI